MHELGFLGQDSLEEAVSRLKSKGQEFSRAYAVHMANRQKVANNPQLLAKWNSITSYADKTKAVIQTINNSVDKSVNWLKDVFGVQSSNLQGMSEVGALPLVPIAYVVGAITALSYVIGEIYKFNQLVNSGATPGEIITGPKGPLTDLSSMVKWAVIGGAIWLIVSKWGK